MLNISRFPSLLVLLAIAIGVVATGCSTTPTASDTETSVLELDVEPSEATLYIDGEYHGEVEAWHEQRVPIEPGPRRVELRASGYLSQRFDLDVTPDRWLNLRVRLEPEIDAPASPDDDQNTDPTAPPEPPFESPLP